MPLSVPRTLINIVYKRHFVKGKSATSEDPKGRVPRAAAVGEWPVRPKGAERSSKDFEGTTGSARGDSTRLAGKDSSNYCPQDGESL